MTAPKFKRLAPAARAEELVQAGLNVLARGGITGFTIDNIAAASGASRGLVSHYFGGKDGLLAACYSAAYAPLLQALRAGATPLPLPALLDELLSDRQLRADGLNIWLALWGEIAINPTLRAAHLDHHRSYSGAIAASLARHWGRTAPNPGDQTLATALVALMDGIWLEFCIAPEIMDRPRARAAIEALLRPHLGPI